MIGNNSIIFQLSGQTLTWVDKENEGGIYYKSMKFLSIIVIYVPYVTQKDNIFDDLVLLFDRDTYATCVQYDYITSNVKMTQRKDLAGIYNDLYILIIIIFFNISFLYLVCSYKERERIRFENFLTTSQNFQTDFPVKCRITCNLQKIANI